MECCTNNIISSHTVDNLLNCVCESSNFIRNKNPLQTIFSRCSMVIKSVKSSECTLTSTLVFFLPEYVLCINPKRRLHTFDCTLFEVNWHLVEQYKTIRLESSLKFPLSFSSWTVIVWYCAERLMQWEQIFFRLCVYTIYYYLESAIVHTI